MGDNFNDNLKEARLRSGLSQKDLHGLLLLLQMDYGSEALFLP